MIDHFHNKYLQPTFIYFSNSDHSLHSRGESLLVWWVPRGEGRAPVDITVDAKFTCFANIHLPPGSTLESVVWEDGEILKKYQQSVSPTHLLLEVELFK